MRLFFIALFSTSFCIPLRAHPPDTIAPGISLAVAKATLQKHGYEVDAEKYGLAMASDDSNIELEFCPIDPDITLVIGARISTGIVDSLEIVLIPEQGPKSKRTQMHRPVLEMTLEDNGVYTLKMKRMEKRSLPSK